MVQLPQNEKQTYWSNSRAQMWPSVLTWPWPWPWIFKVKYKISYISAKNGPIAMKQKANILIEFQASNVTNGFDLDHNLDLWIFKVKRDLDLWPHTWPWPWIVMVKFWNGCISEWEGWLTLQKGGGSRLFMTMTMTIWWPRSDVWIYQIVTGVTSVVCVPSTHLVLWSCYLNWYWCDYDRVWLTTHSPVWWWNQNILQNHVNKSMSFLFDMKRSAWEIYHIHLFRWNPWMCFPHICNLGCPDKFFCYCLTNNAAVHIYHNINDACKLLQKYAET